MGLDRIPVELPYCSEHQEQLVDPRHNITDSSIELAVSPAVGTRSRNSISDGRRCILP